ncbi:hypothetical protein L0128_07930 [candidate division KSB1 bacterium]|nr:hypothetical protein [candidate division KSB1 bacterium]
MSQVVFENIKIPKVKNLQFKFELQGEFNITAFVAKQKVNRFLLMNTGNLIHALDPDLVLSDSLFWKVPIGFSTPEKGFLGRIGFILVEAINGNLELENSTPIPELEANAERLYQ